MTNDQYMTGNAGMDKLISESLAKEQINTITNRTYFPSYNKYGVAAKEDRTYKDGTVFASKREMQRYDELLLLEKAGKIKDLQCQVPFVLQEEFISRQWGDVGHILYVADFGYIDISYRKGCEGRKTVEDSKGGVLTDIYKLKKKMFLYKYGDYLFFEV